MNSTQKLILRLLTANDAMTSRDLGVKLGITHHSVNASIKALRNAGVHIYIKSWDMTGGRGRPLHSLSDIARPDTPEPKRKPNSFYRKRLYQKRVGYERAKARSRYKPVSPWDALIYSAPIKRAAKQEGRADG
jgi:biotin operon repressor